ncbi:MULTISPECIES: hypothetical protein [Chryseobacterium]|uniref:Uncharacterized protein n=1 Tax=Chryseobacterium bernardetii TaxID=1241978 RepID=A0A3G6TJ98_9FLAO|nr:MULTISPECIES: hypothetical protein [Chryseobacterium]AZB26696.1 hypothetical protein EG339_19950 [Chryseobacterium bernardetii]UCA60984.1 hypothetical protein KB553_05505 [Chryseobacterium rhizoplanae]
MDSIKTQQLDLITDKKYIDKYFSLVIKKDLNMDINISNEYVVAHNLVSKKLILIKTFSDAALENPELYFLLSSLIQDINLRSLTKTQIVSALENQ